MRLKALKKYNLFLAFLLSLLGFGSACSKHKEISPAYGTMSASYRVYGNISSEDGIRIPGIKVRMTSEHILAGSDTTIYLRDTTSIIADYYGDYDLSMRHYRPINTFKMEFMDVDGIAMGTYQKKDTTIEFINPVFKNGGSWYSGEASEELNVKLKEKK